MDGDLRDAELVCRGCDDLLVGGLQGMLLGDGAVAILHGLL